jgi:protein-L-isoaspartate(D-aspartate) O-methyltransferase
MNRKDTYIHQGQRLRLVETIKNKGIKNKAVLDAISKVPRHLFMEQYLEHRAYEDEALPINSGQTISQPYTVAYQTELLQIEPLDKVLEVGSGSGYQAAVLSEVGARVYTIERHKDLYAHLLFFLPSLGYSQIHCFYGDGYKGLPTYGPFDSIIVTAGAPYIPEDLLSQLKIGGRLVCPVGDQATQKMVRVIRTDEEKFVNEEFGNFLFVPLLKGLN